MYDLKLKFKALNKSHVVQHLRSKSYGYSASAQIRSEYSIFVCVMKQSSKCTSCATNGEPFDLFWYRKHTSVSFAALCNTFVLSCRSGSNI